MFSPLPALTTLIAVLLYLVTIVNVAFARNKYKVAAPAIVGNVDFERIFRIQMNTLEQLAVFLPSLWLFALFLNPAWASVIGAVWIIGRALYAVGYARAAAKRGPGFVIAEVAAVTLWLGALWGVIGALVRG